MVIHSFRSLSCDRSIASSKASSPHSRSSASSFNLQYLRSSLRSSRNCLHRLRRLPVLSTFPSETYFKRQFLRKTWPIQFDFLLFIVRRIFLSLWTLMLHFVTSHPIGPTDLLHSSAPPHSQTLRVFLLSFLKGPTFNTLLTCYKCRTLLVSSLTLSQVYMLRLVWWYQLWSTKWT
jgi:hypothetical protein